MKRDHQNKIGRQEIAKGNAPKAPGAKSTLPDRVDKKELTKKRQAPKQRKQQVEDEDESWSEDYNTSKKIKPVPKTKELGSGN